MNDMERRKFEDSFKDAFNDAGVTPSENVWTNIELDLEKASGSKMKRRILFYKLLAAASVAFAMAAGSVGYFGYTSRQNNVALAGNADQKTAASQNQQEQSLSAATTSEVGLSSERVQQSSSDATLSSVAPDGIGAANVNKNTADMEKTIASSSVPFESGYDTKDTKQATPDNAADEVRSPQSRKNLIAPSSSEGTRKTVAPEDPNGGARSIDTAPNTAHNRQAIKYASVPHDATTAQPEAKSNRVKQDDKIDQGTASSNPAFADVSSEKGRETANAERFESAVASTIDKSQSSTANGNSENVPNASAKQQTLQSSATGDVAFVNKQKSTSQSVSDEAYVSGVNDKSLPVLARKQKVQFVDPRKSSADPVQIMMARLADQEKRMSTTAKKDKNDKSSKAESLWTSVAFAAGSFNTSNGRVSSSESNAFVVNSIANQQAKATGSSYSVGVSVGTKISERWVLQGGVNYMTQSSDYTASGLIGAADNSTFSVATVQQLNNLFNSSSESAPNAKYVPTTEYDITSSLAYMSVPVQAGYIVVNRKLALQLNAGVSTDLFLQNTLATDGDGVDKTTQGSGDDSPYRTVNFSGLLGTEVSYKLGTHYRLALNPGVRYPLNSIYKSDIGIEAMPLTFDVGLKFRYIFH